MSRSLPAGAAMPLCWSQAEYVSVVGSRHDGICFNRVGPALQRYVVNPLRSRAEIWSFRHQLRRMSHGRILRIIVTTDPTLVWSAHEWASTKRADTTNNSALNVWFADLSTENRSGGLVIEYALVSKKRSAGKAGTTQSRSADHSNGASVMRKSISNERAQNQYSGR